MMNVNNTHRILKVFKYENESEFLWDKKINNISEPIYIIIKYKSEYILHGFNMTNENGPMVLARDVKCVEFLDDVDIRKLKPFQVIYCEANNQIYQYYDSKLDKGFIFISQDKDGNYGICYFDDKIKISNKIRIYETCESMVNDLFVDIDWEKVFVDANGEINTIEKIELKEVIEPFICYCKENRNLYCCIDSDNLNLIQRNVYKLEEYENYPKVDGQLYVSSARHLFTLDENDVKVGKVYIPHRVDNIDFVYNDANVKIVLE